MKTDCGQVSYLQQKHWCPRQLSPIFWQWSFNNFSFSEIFLPYLVLWKLMSECLNRQFVICTSERDIYSEEIAATASSGYRVYCILPTYRNQIHRLTLFRAHTLLIIGAVFGIGRRNCMQNLERLQTRYYILKSNWSFFQVSSVTFKWGTYKA